MPLEKVNGEGQWEDSDWSCRMQNVEEIMAGEKKILGTRNVQMNPKKSGVPY